jgi:hypothetical protein
MGNNVGQGSLAKSREPMEKHMVERFISASGRLYKYVEVFFDQVLADIMLESPRPQVLLSRQVFRFRLAADNSFFMDHASDLNVSRISCSKPISARDSGGKRLFMFASAIWARLCE